MNTGQRNSSQALLPAIKPIRKEVGYDLYPSFPLPSGSIQPGYNALAEICINHKLVILDGYQGVFWDEVKNLLNKEFQQLGVDAHWVDFSKYLLSPTTLLPLLSPYLGGNDPLFGTRTPLKLIDFFDKQQISQISLRENDSVTVIYGTASFLSGFEGFRIYLDIPKNEIQYRARAGSITNLGWNAPMDPGLMYKHFYFVDWVVLNRHKQAFLDQIDVFADVQRPGEILWASASAIRQGFTEMSRNLFRVRPWFEPGVWGGNWIKEHIPGINPQVPNYAWSFELIVPENGLLFESDDRLMELSFDWLMYAEASNVLGDCFNRYGTEFPIRFDFLDTFDGGNLSIQCHPQPDYIKVHFAENFTQEESYYILDTKENAQVYLGFQDNIHPAAFRSALEKSYSDSVPVDIGQYVQKHPASRHDLFLIPYGTIHGSGKNNLVLEISTTPYIFTFKLYDWLRPDLNGNPRPLNIQRGMDNLIFDRKGNQVKQELISKPVLLKKGDNWELWHLPTHATHSYGVRRYCFTGSVTIENQDKCHVLSLVEGTSVLVMTHNGMKQHFHYAETFVIPAAAQSYTLINHGSSKAMVVLAFMK